MIVDLLFQNLVLMHGTDASALEAEIAAAIQTHEGKVRTHDYPSGGQSRKVLESLPVGFPKFRASVTRAGLIVERMRFPGDALYLSTASSAALSIARPPEMPQTLVAGMRGTPVIDVVAGDGFCERMTIVAASAGTRREGGRTMPTLELAIDMPTTVLAGGGGVEKVLRPVPKPTAFLSERFGRYGDDLAADIIGSIDPLDPRRWNDVLSWHGAILGLRTEQRMGVEHLVLRFPYDKTLVDRVGRGGFGAWYDRTTWSWCMAGHDFDPEAMLAAIGGMSPVFILDQERAVYGGSAG